MDYKEAFSILTKGIPGFEKCERPKKSKTFEKEILTDEQKNKKIKQEHGIRTYSSASTVPNVIAGWNELVKFSENQQETEIDKLIGQTANQAGFSVPTPIQMQTLPIMFKDFHSINVAPTGSGKTLAFLLPLIRCAALDKLRNPVECAPPASSPIAIIICPTLELANQIFFEAQRLVAFAKRQSSSPPENEEKEESSFSRAVSEAMNISVRFLRRTKQPPFQKERSSGANQDEKRECARKRKFEHLEDDEIISKKQKVAENDGDERQGDVSSRRGEWPPIWLRDGEPVDILVTTPKRLELLLTMAGKKQKKNLLQLDRLRWLVLDEFDRLFETARRSFREQLENIWAAIHRQREHSQKQKQQSPHREEEIGVTSSPPPPLKVGLFSATSSDSVIGWAEQNLGAARIHVTVGEKMAAAQNVRQRLCFCAEESLKLEQIRKLLTSSTTSFSDNQGGFGGGGGDTKIVFPCLIFTDNCERAQLLFEHILSMEMSSSAAASHSNTTAPLLPLVLPACITGRMAESKRLRLVEAFRRGRIHILVASGVLARGIDLSGLGTVINFDLPTSAAEYIHRIGRTGRAGARGLAVSLWTHEDVPGGGVELGDTKWQQFLGGEGGEGGAGRRKNRRRPGSGKGGGNASAVKHFVAGGGLWEVLKVMRQSGQPADEELERIVRRRHNQYKKFQRPKEMQSRTRNDAQNDKEEDDNADHDEDENAEKKQEDEECGEEEEVDKEKIKERETSQREFRVWNPKRVGTFPKRSAYLCNRANNALNDVRVRRQIDEILK